MKNNIENKIKKHKNGITWIARTLYSKKYATKKTRNNSWY